MILRVLGLPESTRLDRRIPKQKFYERLDANSALKRVFVEQIESIVWRASISPRTTNLAPGATTPELEIVEIALLTPTLDAATLREIDRSIPHPTLFLLEFEGRYAAWLSYKEVGASTRTERVSVETSDFYRTEPVDADALPCKMEGWNVDLVYENFARQIAGSALPTTESGTLREAVKLANERRRLEKKIAALKGKIRRERQLNRQLELRAEEKRLERRLKELGDG